MNVAKYALAEQDQPARAARRPDRPRSPGADVFLGLSGSTVPESVIETMADDAIVFALSNPDPEIDPAVARDARIGRGDRPQRLPEPDQQRARVPRGLRGRARRLPPGASPST